MKEFKVKPQTITEACKSQPNPFNQSLQKVHTNETPKPITSLRRRTSILILEWVDELKENQKVKLVG
jgi:hypothetical protein